MMNAKQAMERILGEYPREAITVAECLEFPEFFAFDIVEKGHENEDRGGGYDTVDKSTGKIGGFVPTQDFEAFENAKTIDLDEL